MFPDATSGVSSHLGGKDTWGRAGVSVGVAGMVHAVGIVMKIGAVTPENSNTLDCDCEDSEST